MNLDEFITVSDNTLEIAEPEHKDANIELLFDHTPDRLSPCIDFYYGRPAICIYTYHQEEPEYIILFPTADDPHVRTLMDGDWYNDELAEELRENHSD